MLVSRSAGLILKWGGAKSGKGTGKFFRNGTKSCILRDPSAKKVKGGWAIALPRTDATGE